MKYGLKRGLLLLVVCLLSCLKTYAYDFEVDGIYYNKLSEDKVEVTCLDRTDKNANAYIGDVVIPETVTYQDGKYNVVAIGDFALHFCWRVTSVKLPQSIVRIGEQAFHRCMGVKSINVPNGVTEFGVAAFGSCHMLTNINIPDGLTHIVDRLCDDCQSLVSIKLPETITEIGKMAFWGCLSLKNINIPEAVTTIKASAFAQCTSLTNITLPNTLAVIEDRVFSGSALTSIKIPDGIVALSAMAFHECDSLDPSKIEFANNGTRGECNGHQWVDLGLPSGKKWATCNVGASTPEQTGEFFAWGETKTKSTYAERDSKAAGKRTGDISGNHEYDTAAALWAGGWRMPTMEEWQELSKHCRWTDREINGQCVKQVISKTNGNFIYIPHAGHRLLDEHKQHNSWGRYWSSTPCGEVAGRANYFSFFSTAGGGFSTSFLGVGRPIRAIMD